VQGQSLELRGRAIGPVHLWPCVAGTVEVGPQQGFQHGGRREDDGEPRSRKQIALRATRFDPHSVALTRPPPCFLRVEILPALRTAHVAGSNAGLKRLPCRWVAPRFDYRTWIAPQRRVRRPAVPRPRTAVANKASDAGSGTAGAGAWMLMTKLSA
jgi:hypothetical protein